MEKTIWQSREGLNPIMEKNNWANVRLWQYDMQGEQTQDIQIQFRYPLKGGSNPIENLIHIMNVVKSDNDEKIEVQLRYNQHLNDASYALA